MLTRRIKNRRRLTALLLVCLLLFMTAGGRAYAYEDKPVTVHGFLKAAGDNIVRDAGGAAVQLTGVSLGNAYREDGCPGSEALQALARDFGINTASIRVDTGSDQGYCSGDEYRRAVIRSNVYTALNAAIYEDLYMVLEWHQTDAGEPQEYQTDSLAFLGEIASVYSAFPNVIYALTLPENADDWSTALVRLTEAIDTIRSFSPSALIIAQTLTDASGMAAAVREPIAREGILYGIRAELCEASAQLYDTTASCGTSLPFFVFAGAGGDPEAFSADMLASWMSLCSYYQAGFMCGPLVTEEESLGLLPADTTAASGWSETDYTVLGKSLYDIARGSAPLPPFSVPDVALSTAAQTQAAASSTWYFPGDIAVTVSSSECRPDETGYSSSCDITIVNNGSVELSDWHLQLFWSSDVDVLEYWSCQVGGTGNSRTCIAVDYNHQIPAGSSAELGLVISGTAAPVLNNVVLQ